MYYIYYGLLFIYKVLGYYEPFSHNSDERNVQRVGT